MTELDAEEAAPSLRFHIVKGIEKRHHTVSPLRQATAVLVAR